MHLRQIEIFYSVIKYGSMRSAAKMLNITQPSISKTIAHFEYQLGFSLFHRVKGRLVPTEQAMVLFQQAAPVFIGVSKLEGLAEKLKTTKVKTLRVSGLAAFSNNILPKALAQASEQQGKGAAFNYYALSRDSIMSVSGLLDRSIDCSLVLNVECPPNIKAHFLAKSHLVAVVPKGELPADKKSVTIKELESLNLPLNRLCTEYPLGALVQKLCDDAECKFKSGIEVESYFIAANISNEGKSISIVDNISASGNALNNVDVIPITPKQTFDVTLLTHHAFEYEDRLQPLIKALKEQLN